MELRQLRYFITVLEEGNLSKAAKKLNMSQPPLSTQMKALEREIGCELFTRGARKVVPTAAGQLLRERAEAILTLCRTTEKELKEYGSGAAGTLRLGVVSSVSSLLSDEWMPGFCARHPRIRFELFEANTYQLIDQLHAGVIEMAVVRSPFPTDGVSRIPLYKEPMLAVGHASFFRGLGEGAVNLAELSERPLILYRRWEQFLLEQMEQAGGRPNVICRNDDARTTALWADAGLGIGIIPSSAAALLRGDETRTREIQDGGVSSRIEVVTVQRAQISGVGAAFLDFIRERRGDKKWGKIEDTL